MKTEGEIYLYPGVMIYGDPKWKGWFLSIRKWSYVARWSLWINLTKKGENHE